MTLTFLIGILLYGVNDSLTVTYHIEGVTEEQTGTPLQFLRWYMKHRKEVR